MADGVGIDLGTTHCCLYVQKKDSLVPQLLKYNGVWATTPSWVRFDRDGTTVGLYAKKRSPSNPKNTVLNAKRLIGRAFENRDVQNERERMPFSIINQGGSPMIQVQEENKAGDVVWSKTISPVDVSSIMLKHLKEMAVDFLRTENFAAVITVPANFSAPQKAATLEAAKKAGLNGVTLINEPTAAAVAYGAVANEQSNILVFDFGGGTLDITIMEVKAKNEYVVLATDGDMYLGGENFDSEIVDYFFQDIQKKHDINLARDSKARAILKLAAEDAKIELSQGGTKFGETIYNLQPGLNYEAELKKDTFCNMFGGILEKILVPVKNALQSINLSATDIDKVILVGGSTKLPAVRQTVEKFFKTVAVCADLNPDEAIAKGAAIQSFRINNHVPSNVTEITAFHYGLQMLNDKNETYIRELVAKSTVYPCSHITKGSTPYDNQTRVLFEVFQSKRGFQIDKFRIGTFVISDLPPRKAGGCSFQITYKIDSSHILHVSAQGTGDIAHYKKEIAIDITNV